MMGPNLADQEVAGYRVLHRLDRGDRAWCYRARGLGGDVVVKFIKSPSDLLEEAEVHRLSHPSIPWLIAAGLAWGRYYLIRDWVEGETFDEVVEQRGSRQNTIRLCRAVFRLADLLASLHSETELGPSRVHGALTGRNVIVGSRGEIGLINCDRSHLSKVPRLHPNFEAFVTYDYASIGRDVDALHALFQKIWLPLSRPVVDFDAAIPGPIRELRDETFESARSFRSALDVALTASGFKPKPGSAPRIR